MQNVKTVRILSLDPSTDMTGIALVEWDAKGTPRLLGSASFCANRALKTEGKGVHKETETDANRIWRIRWTRTALGAWVAALPYSFDAVAYEEPNQRGAGATAGLHQAIGSYLTLPSLGGVPVIAVHSSTVKAQAKISQHRASGQTAETLGEKALMCRWAEGLFHVPFKGKAGEAEADAIGVGSGAYKLMLGQNDFVSPTRKKKVKKTCVR